jgi:diaminopimelate epimerase
MPSEIADFRMRIFNADGSEAVMCGNASRCVAKYVYDNGMTAHNPVTLETLAGIKTLHMQIENKEVRSVTVDMGPPILNPADIPCDFSGDFAMMQPLPGTDYLVTCVSMGNPHCVIFANDIEGLPLWQVGPPLENHPAFPDRANIEFVRVIDRKTRLGRVCGGGGGGAEWALRQRHRHQGKNAGRNRDRPSYRQRRNSDRRVRKSV